MQKTLFPGSKKGEFLFPKAFTLAATLIVLVISSTLLASLWAFTSQRVEVVEKEKKDFVQSINWENQLIEKKITGWVRSDDETF